MALSEAIIRGWSVMYRRISSLSMIDLNCSASNSFRRLLMKSPASQICGLQWLADGAKTERWELGDNGEEVERPKSGLSLNGESALLLVLVLAPTLATSGAGMVAPKSLLKVFLPS